MKRIHELKEYLEHEYKESRTIETSDRNEKLKPMLLEVINTYNPPVVVKMGLGSGEIAEYLLDIMDGVLVVLDPSVDSLRKFQQKIGKKKNQLYAVAGTLDSNPIDYYVSKCTVSVDNLNFIDSAVAIDEMRRNIDFESILFIASPVLSPEDEDSKGDALLKMVNPLHNEYYMKDELNTVLKLNEFKLVSEKIEATEISFSYMKNNETQYEALQNFCKANEDDLAAFYKLKGDVVEMPYYMGYYMRMKPPKEEIKE